MKTLSIVILISCTLLLGVAATSGQGEKGADTADVSFKNSIMPIIKKSCLPCHAEENFNPSELSLDSYDLLMEGGKHGTPVFPGKPTDSILLQKIESNPPFGDRMPLDRNKKKGEPSSKKLSDDEINLIEAWVRQGAKNN